MLRRLLHKLLLTVANLITQISIRSLLSFLRNVGLVFLLQSPHETLFCFFYLSNKVIFVCVFVLLLVLFYII